MLKDQIFCSNIKLGRGNINYSIVFFDTSSCFDFREFYPAMFKSLNDTSKYFFPLEDLLLSTERMTKVLKKNPKQPQTSLLFCSGTSYLFFHVPPCPVSLEICVELVFKQQCHCSFAHKLPLKWFTIVSFLFICLVILLGLRLASFNC